MSSTLELISNREAFAHIWNVAKVYASSQLIPPHLRGKVEDVFLALTMAEQLGENPVVVMQSIYIVSGRAGWSAQYMIARANRSGIFRGRINWRVTGTGKDLSVTAYATLADTGEEVSIAASMAMATAEGWTKNTKYNSMPEVMLRYRSATLLIRMYAPDVMLGYSTVEEIETLPIADGVEVVTAPQRGRSALGLDPAKRALPDHGIDPGEALAEQARSAEAERAGREEAGRVEGDEQAGAPAEQEQGSFAPSPEEQAEIRRQEAEEAAQQAPRHATSSRARPAGFGGNQGGK